ncbi:HNH endonuclease [Paenibacillus sp. 1P07SE]|uniref:HNH endonuclease n=1 Tax=Paenibacillus sp. 1P07SE TaxID=3132209 RepID=UPI0039A7704D
MTTNHSHSEPEITEETVQHKTCVSCGLSKPAHEFLRRTGKRSRQGARRGTCKECRQAQSSSSASAPSPSPEEQEAPAPVKRSSSGRSRAKRKKRAGVNGSDEILDIASDADKPEDHQDFPADPGTADATLAEQAQPTQGDGSIWGAGGPDASSPRDEEEADSQSPRKPRKRKRKRKSKASPLVPASPAAPRVKPVTSKKKLPQHASLMQVETPDVSGLRTTKRGVVWMRGRTEKGRRWHQETDLETAQVLVREHAAVILNPFTVQRLYSNKTFRSYILTRDRYTCYFCGGYGDTIDHLLPRAKGGHTTPLNCVCACNLCNQSKADRDMDEFMQNFVPPVSE